MKAFTILACLMLYCTSAHAEVPESLAVRAIIGEASGEGELAMSAHAHAIRNRGHLRGVYGLNARHIDTEPTWVWKQASKAWSDSERGSDPTGGADHWFSEDDLRKLNRTRPRWFLNLKRTVKIGTTTFYKEV